MKRFVVLLQIRNTVRLEVDAEEDVAAIEAAEVRALHGDGDAELNDIQPIDVWEAPQIALREARREGESDAQATTR